MDVVQVLLEVLALKLRHPTRQAATPLLKAAVSPLFITQIDASQSFPFEISNLCGPQQGHLQARSVNVALKLI